MIGPFAPWQDALGWALVHSLWQGVAAALLLAALLHVSRSSSVRYCLSCLALLAALLAPAATFASLLHTEPAPPTELARAQAELRPEGWTSFGTAVGEGEGSPVRAVATAAVRRWAGTSEVVIPWLVRGWLAGVLVLSLRLLGGWLWVQRLVRSTLVPARAEWTTVLDRLCGQLGIRRRVALFLSPHVSGPSLVGWVRPVVLLPLSASSGLTPQQVEIFLLHELLHVRRWDYLVNLLQRLAEVVLFYHPATWWLSARIRAEREHCCDDEVVSRWGVGDYVSALLALEVARGPAPSLALGAADASLVARVRRLADPRRTQRLGRTGPVLGMGLALLAVALSAMPTAANKTVAARGLDAPAAPCATPGSGTTICTGLAVPVGALLREAGVPGLVIVQDVETGAVLAYERTGEGDAAVDGTRPLLPASLWKLAVAAVWWDRGLGEMQIDCPAAIRIGRRTVRTGGSDGLGMLAAPEEVLVHSCNTAAVAMMLRLARDGGTARLAAELRRLGFPVARDGERPHPDTAFWAAGSGASRGRMAPLAGTIRLESDTPEAMASLALATSSVRLSPLHLSRFLQAVGNGGVMRAPTLDVSPTGAAPGVPVMSASTARHLQEAMLRTVREGTAQAAAGMRPGEWRLGGKTGTLDGATAGELDGWFGGLVVDPQGRARYTALVYLRGGGPGGDRPTRLAARIARTLVGAPAAVGDGG